MVDSFLFFFRKLGAWTISQCKLGIESKTVRLVSLAGAAWLGLYLGPEVSCLIKGIFSLNKNLTEYFQPFAVSVFVITLLWFFRTYDTRQKIYQDDLFKGLDNLASDNPLQADIGVAMLITISKKVPSFNETIKVAFVRRLKSAPKQHEKYKYNLLSYAQHIIRWLIWYKEENKNVRYDLNGMDLSYQEFIIGNDKEKIIFKKLFSSDSLPKSFSLHYANVTGIDFINLTIGTFDDGKFFNNIVEQLERNPKLIECCEDKCFKNLSVTSMSSSN